MVRRAKRTGGGVFFITGTDTGVGKTFLTVALLRELRRQGIRAAGLKPIACGGREDAEQLARFSAGGFSASDLNPVYLPRPVAPPAQRCPAWSRLLLQVRASLARLRTAGLEIVLVEGAGGLLCPIDRHHTMRELARALNAPIMLVARDQLGVLNHVLLTLECAEHASLSCTAVVLNRFGRRTDPSQAMNATLLERLTRIPIHRMF
jgi:dethiobiotin synthetase